ncbi:MAG TPA: hypothetical protein VJV23_01605 [Candidatus Polarisedimenticolia bacterium]|nr:hypothetical protein [Candidatus Polarisedimenticolia bacterium]
MRAVVAGDGPVGRETARLLARAEVAEVALVCGSPGAAAGAQRDLGGRVRGAASLEEAGPADVVVLTEPSEAVRAARDAARICPATVLLLAMPGSLELCREAARGSGLRPARILATGGVAFAAREAARLARMHGAAASQIAVPVIGGGEDSELRSLLRYASLAGIPLRPVSPSAAAPPGGISPRAAAAVARAVLTDSRRVLCCASWIGEGHGLAGGFATLPFPVGARGAGPPLPLSLTLEERSILQRVSVR